MKALRHIAIVAAAGVGIMGLQVSAGHAADCQKFGGWGTGALEGFASFMAEAAMKNAAKAKYGDSVKIGPVAKKCSVPNLLWECTAAARACK